MNSFMPMKRHNPFFSPGTLVLLGIMVVGYGFALARMLVGLGPVTNLSDSYPWGIWIAIDVATGVALAAGGFTTAALINIFGKRKFHELERAALLTAWLGYTFVGIGLLFDLGRYYNIWHPAVYWQGNSALFEVGMCVMFYLTVLTVEFLPTLTTGLIDMAGEEHFFTPLLKKIKRPAEIARSVARKVMPIFIIAGVVLSSMHQSSLGTLLLIAPSKMSHLWWTPILSLNFLLSAIMVGFPVVIFESIVASTKFHKRQEMELLTPLSAYIPWFIALYAGVRFTDFFIRNDASLLLENPGQTIALIIEVVLGLLVPFVMLLRKSVRNSHRWLFVTVCFIIGGVVINRINVFLTAYRPMNATVGYFPSIGEIAVTAGLVATIIFIYRFFAMYFPVLPVDEEVRKKPSINEPLEKSHIVTLLLRASALLIIVLFAVIYAAVHNKAEQASQTALLDLSRLAVPEVEANRRVHLDNRVEFFTNPMPTGITISHPINNKGGDFYEPVRFMHKAHTSHVNGDCTVCHHRITTGEGDTVGKKIDQLELQKIRIESCNSCHRYSLEHVQQTHENLRGDCSVCHHRFDPYNFRKYLKEFKFTSCSSCHKDSVSSAENTVNRGTALKPGLKGAYHQQCIECHKENSKSAPTDCLGCHFKTIPDHNKHITLKGSPKPSEMTAHCISCHKQQGKDVQSTLHWNRPEDKTAKDCLTCHDTTGEYRRSKTLDDRVEAGVDIIKIAKAAGRPSRESCGACHAREKGGAKEGETADVHMYTNKMLCQNCHKTKRHNISGRTVGNLKNERAVSCGQCHGKEPHKIQGVLGFHLDKHSARLSCQLCHIPTDKSSLKVTWYADSDANHLNAQTSSVPDADGCIVTNPLKGEIQNSSAKIYRFDLLPDEACVPGNNRRTTVLANHDVIAKNKSLGCRDCHSEEAANCLWCHQFMPSDKVKALIKPTVTDGSVKYIDFETLGYNRDPALNSWFRVQKENVTGTHRLLLEGDARMLCLKCHVKQADEAKLKNAHSPVINEKSCENCHVHHSSNVKDFLRDNQFNLCTKCHNKPIKGAKGRIVADVAKQAQKSLSQHGPFKDKDCSACHAVHGSTYAGLLKAQYPWSFYQKYNTGAYAACYNCHEKGRIEAEKTTTLTGFRDGEENLHFVHVIKPGDKGKSCGVCHESHAATQAHLMKTRVPYAKTGWDLPIQYTALKTGGRCDKSCHDGREYNNGGSRPGNVGDKYTKAAAKEREQKSAGLSVLFYNYAMRLFTTENFDFALEQVERAIAENPNFADAYALKGEILLSQKKCALAKTAFDKASAVAPDNEPAKKGRLALDNLKKNNLCPDGKAL